MNNQQNSEHSTSNAQHPSFKAGKAVVDISPEKSMFLWGYPHVERMSTGINDSLYACVLYLVNDSSALMTIALDLLYISAEDVLDIRSRIAEQISIELANIMISCSHTHSGPVTVDLVISGSDPVVPPVDKEYMGIVKDKIVDAAVRAANDVIDAEVAVTSAEISGVGCNRNAPDGLRDPEAGIVVVRDCLSKKLFAVSLVYCMHPTVLHEDSTLVSSDFPGYARKCMQASLGDDVMVSYHTGPQGNQSPRYHVKAQTFAEAERLGNILGGSVVDAVVNLEDEDFNNSPVIAARVDVAKSVRKPVKSVSDAEENLEFRKNEFERLKNEKAGHGPIRTAECSLFGAEEAVYVAKCAENGSLNAALQGYADLEVQIFRIGECCLVGLQGELFVEYSLAIKEKSKGRTFVLCCTNGETQGYIVTEDATGYEADNALFAPATGEAMVETALRLLGEI